MIRRFSIGRAHGVRGVIGVLLIGTLALAGPAFAGKKAPAAKTPAVKQPAAKAPAAKESVKIVTNYWTIAVNEHSYEVKAGGEIIYHACDTVESITPIVKVKTKGKAENSYVAALVGPKSVGMSDGIERSFDGPRGVIEPPFVANQFSRLTAATNVPRIPPGTYKLNLMINGKAAKPKPAEKIKLVSKEGC